MQKIRLAIISCYGLDKGGTEKFLQTVAANLPKDKYDVDYYYIDSNVMRVSATKMQYLNDNNVCLIPYQVKDIIAKKRYIMQTESSFFDVYKNNYDLLLTGSCGYPEEPMTKIRDTPIVQSIHYVSGADNQYNISRVLHISEFSKNAWLKKGGDIKRIEMISHPIQIPTFHKINMRKQFGIDKDAIVYGLHQRDDDYIFSDIPLDAYKRIESEKTAFILCGGSKRYREQARDLNLLHCYFIPYTDENDVIYSFLASIDVYAHGRFDGELNSTALAEAMYFGLPIITHPSGLYNGHLEVIRENGYVAENSQEYASYMKLFMEEEEVREKCSIESQKVFEANYNLDIQINKIMNIFEDVLKKPYPNPVRRRYRDSVNRVFNIAKKTLLILSRNLR